MGDYDAILEMFSSEDSERLLEIARFAELGMSSSAVIHELRQPLTALSMALQMALESARGKDPEVERGITEAIQLSTKADMLLQRARDFMRPSTGLVEIDIEDCIAKVLSIFQWQLSDKKNLRIKHSVEHGPLTIMGDKAQIEQMIANLISNGLDAISDKGEGTVHVLARKKDGKGIEVVVADDGNGVTRETESRMFEPFFSTKGAAKGTGLGLYIVSKIASRHGAVCAFLHKDELEKMGLGDVTTGFSVNFTEETK